VNTAQQSTTVPALVDSFLSWPFSPEFAAKMDRKFWGWVYGNPDLAPKSWSELAQNSFHTLPLLGEVTRPLSDRQIGVLKSEAYAMEKLAGASDARAAETAGLVDKQIPKPPAGKIPAIGMGAIVIGALVIFLLVRR
jgi:hypothetical protein